MARDSNAAPPHSPEGELLKAEAQGAMRVLAVFSIFLSGAAASIFKPELDDVGDGVQEHGDFSDCEK